MTGQTKFLGFGLESTVVLERYGEKVKTPLPAPAIEALRDACYQKLPKAPKEPRKMSTSFAFVESTPGIAAQLTREDAEALLRTLSLGIRDSDKDETDVRFIQDLTSAIEEYDRHFDGQEPGVAGDAPGVEDA